MDLWVSRGTDRWICGWVSGWVEGREGLGGCVVGETEGWMNELTDKWVDAWMDGRTDGWTDGQTDGQVGGACICLSQPCGTIVILGLSAFLCA